MTLVTYAHFRDPHAYSTFVADASCARCGTVGAYWVMGAARDGSCTGDDDDDGDDETWSF